MKPNMVNNPVYFYLPGLSTLNNTISLGIDSATSSDDLYVHTYSATVPESYNERNWTVDDQTTDLAIGARIALGIPIQANNEFGDMVIQVNGSVNFYNSGQASVYPFFGRAISNTVVASTTTAENKLADSWIILPCLSANTGTSPRTSTCKQDIYKFVDTASTYPYFFGYVIENNSGSAIQLDNLRVSLSIRSYITEIAAFKPSR